MERPLRLAVLCDPLDEGWPSMDLAGDMLLSHLTAPEVAATRIRPSMRRLARRLPRLGRARAALNADRLALRYLDYPAQLWRLRSRFDAFHVVDHTYAQLVHVLPAGRAGVYCHDLDAFRCLLTPEAEPRPAWFRALIRTALVGLCKAAVVFYSTEPVRAALLRHLPLDPARLVHAPYGTAPEFTAEPTRPLPEPLRQALAGRRFVLHVGSELPRKRLDVLFEVFARLHARDPELRLVQRGATLSPAHRAHLRALGIEHAMLQPPPMARATLAAVYQHAELVLVTSESEGFGLPLIEALACGCRVVASDLPVLREVGGAAATYCPMGGVDAWAEASWTLLESRSAGPSAEIRKQQAARFTWRRHAEAVLDGYRRWVL